MTIFYYAQIDRPFIEGLGDKLLLGESVVLLGPRYGGKKHVMRRLMSLLGQRDAAPVVQLQIAAEPPVATLKHLQNLISHAVNGAHAPQPPARHSDDRLLTPVDGMSLQLQRPVILFASNIDSMAPHLTRRFLEEVRTSVEAGRLIAVLSGEHDLRDIVHGPNSEFNCANQYVVQGCGQDEFDSYLFSICDSLNVKFEGPREASGILLQLTGGNLYLLKKILLALVEVRDEDNVAGNRAIKAQEITGMVRASTDFIYDEVFRHHVQVIMREPKSLEMLERLISDEPVTLGLDQNAPTPLELAGLAVRDVSHAGARLRLTSRLVEDFVRRHFDARRLGDFYARAGQWEKAFEQYSRIDDEARMRPLSVDDRLEVEATINALSAALYLKAIDGVEAVRDLFVRGCIYTLGFREVTFWHYEPWDSGNGWRPMPSSVSAYELSPHSMTRIAGHLPTGGSLQPGLLMIKGPDSRYLTGAILPNVSSERHFAVVVGNSETPTVMSRERELIITGLLRHYMEAHQRALTLENLQSRLAARNQHVEIMQSIFESLGSHTPDVGAALAKTAHGLRNLGYRRVIFSLVDPERQKIQGVADYSDDVSANLATLINWPLSHPTNDIQSFVVQTRQARIVYDATAEPLVDQVMARATDSKSFALVPILNPAGDAIGTIYIERNDLTPASRDEVEDLLIFGRQLAIIIEQIERVLCWNPHSTKSRPRS
jgi:GAF domain-containing protein